MRLISYRSAGQPGVGVMVDEARFIALRRVLPDLPESLKEILEEGTGALKRIAEAIKGNEGDLRLDQIQLDPVIPDPHATWVLGGTFATPTKKSGRTASPDRLAFVQRLSISVVGHREALWCPPPAIAGRYEPAGALAVVIGQAGRHIPIDRALAHVAGYACYNDGTVREFAGDSPFALSKNFERSGSFGPWLMTPEEFGDEFGDPPRHRLITRLNRAELRSAAFGDISVSLAHAIHDLSTGYTLQPGDVIVMGVSGDVPRPDGSAQSSSRARMQPGDLCAIEITGLGILTNPVIADPTPL